MAKKLGKLFQRVRVTSGYIFAIIFIVFCRPTAELLIIGSAVAVLGLLIRAWACGHLRKVAELDTSGPYAYTRNPLYLGSFLITVGFAVASGVWWLAAISIIFFLGIYLPVMNVEKSELEEVIGDEYRAYVRDVPVFVPRVTPGRSSDRRFDFQLYLKNGEYSAALGVAATVLILVLKAYYSGSL
jgi:protein-S-isoprenylcysteine O-methyltransferase Ste14